MSFSIWNYRLLLYDEFVCKMIYSDVSDIIAMLEYFKWNLHLSMHDNPVLMYWSTLIYQNYYDIKYLLHLNKLHMFENISPTFYQRGGRVHVDEFSYYMYAIRERYKVCK